MGVWNSWYKMIEWQMQEEWFWDKTMEFKRMDFELALTPIYVNSMSNYWLWASQLPQLIIIITSQNFHFYSPWHSVIISTGGIIVVVQ